MATAVQLLLWTEVAVKCSRAKVARLLLETLIPPSLRLSLAQKQEAKRSHVSDSGNDEEGNAKGGHV